jgi:hypothetical protein
VVSGIGGLELSYGFFRRPDLLTFGLQINLLLALLAVKLFNSVLEGLLFQLQRF